MDKLHIMLLVGAVPTAIMAALVRFAITMNHVPPGPDDAYDVLEVKAAIKLHKRISIALVSASVTLFLLFALV